MPVDIGTGVNFDVGPALAALDRLGLAGTSVRDEQLKSNAAVSQSFSAVAQSAVAYSNELSRQQAEVRGAAAATKSAMEEVRRLTAANKDLAAAQKTASSTDEVKRLGTEITKNTAKIKEAKQAIEENKAATDQAREGVEQAREAQRQYTNETKAGAAAQRDASIAARQTAAMQREAALQAKGQAAAEKQASAEIDKELRSAGLLVQLTRQLADLTERRARATTKEEAQGYTKQIADTKAEIGDLTGELNTASQSGGVLSGVLGKLGAAAIAAFTVDKILAVGREIEEVTAKFEKYRITLTGAFEGDQGRADRALIQVRNFADANGIEIESLTDTYVRLVNRGIIPTTQQLRQLSDIAATSGKSTDQFVEALLDAQTGEFERLKEFGIKVKNNGDTLTFTFRGVKQEVNNTQDAITQYLYALGDAKGVQGQAAAQLKSLGGASIEAKNGLTELYQVIGERSKSIFAGLTNAAGGAARALANYFKSSDQIALEQSAAGIDRYGQLLKVKFAQIAVDTKASGGDVSAALAQAADDQTKFIDAKLAKAKRDLVAYYKSAQEASVASGGEVDAIDPYQVARYQTAIKLYEGQREAAKRAYKDSVEGASAEADQVGRIAALRLKIASEEKARDAAAPTTAGDAQRVRLNAQIDADNKLLQELLGKVDKSAKAQADKLGAALRALQQERATLQSLAAKGAIKESDDAATRATLNFEEQLRQIEVLKQKLVEREAAVRKAGGRGANADGVIDGVQAAEIDKLKVAAQEQLTRELARIERERQALLLSLRQDSDQTELDRLEAAFNEQIRLNEKQAGVRLALEAKYERDREALLKAQATRRAQQEQQFGSAQASATAEVFGTGTGQSVYDAQFAARQQQLDADKTFAEKRLGILKDSKGKEAETERVALAAQLLRIRNQQIELNQEVGKSKFNLYRLVLGENDSPENRQKVDEIVSQSVQAINTVLQAEEQAAQARIELANQNISELQSNLAAQIQLNASGNASNIAGIQAAIAEEKEARRAAIADKRRAQQEEALINTAQQGSALLTAAANLILGWSELPLVGQVLGALSVAAMLASFLAAQSTISAATSGSYFKGGYTGDGNPREVSTAQGRRDYEYHKREFIMRHEVTDVFRHSLLEPLHQDRPQDINWKAPEMRALLPDLELPEKLKAERRLVVEHNLRIGTEPLQAKFDGLHDRLVAIEGHVERTADKKEFLALGEKHVMEIDSKGNTHIKEV